MLLRQVENYFDESLERHVSIALKREDFLAAQKVMTNKNSVFYAALLNFDDEKIEALLKLGVAINEPFPCGDTALILAVKKGYVNAVRLLVSYGATINPTMAGSVSALYLAAQQGHFDIVNILLKNEAEIYLAIQGKTALDIAFENKHFNIADSIIKAWLENFIAANERQLANDWERPIWFTSFFGGYSARKNQLAALALKAVMFAKEDEHSLERHQGPLNWSELGAIYQSWCTNQINKPLYPHHFDLVPLELDLAERMYFYSVP